MVSTAAHVYAVLRGLMLVAACAFLVLRPEQAMAGSSLEPTRALALVFASRTILLGAVLVVLAIRRRQHALGWVLLADAAFQIFDTALALAMHKGAVAVAPAALGAIDVCAALVLLRSARPALPLDTA